MLFVLTRSKKVFAFFIIAFLVYIIGRQTFLSDFIKSFENLLLRFELDDAANGNGRFEAWVAYLEYTFSSARNAFFGCGVSTNFLESNNSVIDMVEHNSIIELIFTVGIFGTIGYLLSMFSMVNMVLRQSAGRRPWMLYMPLLAIVAGYCTINGAFSDRLIYAVYLSACILSLPQDKESIATAEE